MQIPVEAQPKFGLPYLEIYAELRDLPPGTFFSYVVVLNPNPLSDGPDRTIYPGFQILQMLAQRVPVEFAWGPHEGGGYMQVLYHSQHFKTWHPCHHVGPQHKPHQR